MRHDTFHVYDKVRIVEGAHGTAAVTRVLVETADGDGEWDTVGVHENVVAASWDALVDAVTYGLLRRENLDAAREAGVSAGAGTR